MGSNPVTPTNKNKASEMVLFCFQEFVRVRMLKGKTDYPSFENLPLATCDLHSH